MQRFSPLSAPGCPPLGKSRARRGGSHVVIRRDQQWILSLYFVLYSSEERKECPYKSLAQGSGVQEQNHYKPPWKFLASAPATIWQKCYLRAQKKAANSWHSTRAKWFVPVSYIRKYPTYSTTRRQVNSPAPSTTSAPSSRQVRRVYLGFLAPGWALFAPDRADYLATSYKGVL